MIWESPFDSDGKGNALKGPEYPAEEVFAEVRRRIQEIADAKAAS